LKRKCDAVCGISIPQQKEGIFLGYYFAFKVLDASTGVKLFYTFGGDCKESLQFRTPYPIYSSARYWPNREAQLTLTSVSYGESCCSN